MNQRLADEVLEVVDGRDTVIGLARRGDIHAQGLLHRAVHVLVFDQAGRLYLQRRSANKDTHPGKWTSSASGHVDPGESYDQAARRELAEELGLESALEPLGRLAARALTEGEFTAVYRATADQEPRPDPHEISEGRFFGLTEARALAAGPLATPSLGLVLGLLPA